MQETIFIISLMQWCSLLVPIIALCIALSIVILTQQSQTNQHNALLEQIKIGRMVTTIHGLEGKICHVLDNIIIIELASGRKIEIIRQTIKGSTS